MKGHDLVFFVFLFNLIFKVLDLDLVLVGVEALVGHFEERLGVEATERDFKVEWLDGVGVVGEMMDGPGPLFRLILKEEIILFGGRGGGPISPSTFGGLGGGPRFLRPLGGLDGFISARDFLWPTFETFGSFAEETHQDFVAEACEKGVLKPGFYIYKKNNHLVGDWQNQL